MQSKHLSIIYSHQLLGYDFGAEHPFNSVRASLTMDLLEELGVLALPQVQVVAPYQADREDLLLFHSKTYLDFVQNACAVGQGYLDEGDTPAIEGGFEIAATVVGGSLQAVKMIMEQETRYAFVPVGGLHHAHPTRASGFCIFNDLAIAILSLRRDYGIKRVAYIDMDAHQGDGVIYGFYTDPEVLAIDFHEDGRYLFPGTGDIHEIGEGMAIGTKINLPMPPYSSDTSFKLAFDRLVPELLEMFRPEFIFLVAGVDAHQDDPLTHMKYSAASYKYAISALKLLAAKYCDNRLAVFGAGGYNIGTCALRWSEIAANLADFEMPAEVPTAWQTRFANRTNKVAPTVFDEEFTSDNTLERVEKMVDWLRQKTLV